MARCMEISTDWSTENMNLALGYDEYEGIPKQ